MRHRGRQRGGGQEEDAGARGVGGQIEILFPIVPQGFHEKIRSKKDFFADTE